MYFSRVYFHANLLLQKKASMNRRRIFYFRSHVQFLPVSRRFDKLKSFVSRPNVAV